MKPKKVIRYHNWLLNSLESVPVLCHWQVPELSSSQNRSCGRDLHIACPCRYIEIKGNAGFAFEEFLLNPLDFGFPNTRERYYLIAVRVPGQTPDMLSTRNVFPTSS